MVALMHERQEYFILKAHRAKFQRLEACMLDLKQSRKWAHYLKLHIASLTHVSKARTRCA